MWQLSGFLALSLLAAAEVPNDEAKNEQAKLSGTWKAVAVKESGQTRETLDHHLIFTGDEFSLKRGDDTVIKGKFRIDPSKKPKEIDMEIVDSHKGSIKGKISLGIYGLDGDTLRWCSNEPGSTERPKEFSSGSGTKYLLVTFEREKR
jgi:uncharacterized protein (TIGR03067 family)